MSAGIQLLCRSGSGPAAGCGDGEQLRGPQALSSADVGRSSFSPGTLVFMAWPPPRRRRRGRRMIFPRLAGSLSAWMKLCKGDEEKLKRHLCTLMLREA